MIIAIINNISLLVSLSVVYVLIARYLDQSRAEVKVLRGFLFGLFVIFGMYNSVELAPGVIFDGRSIILTVAGLFGGPITAGVAFLLALSYRVYLGGDGMMMGVLVIFQAAALGVVFYYLIKGKRKKTPHRYYIMVSFLVHFIMLLLVLAIPANMRPDVFSSVWFPVLLIYPLASYLVCVLFYSQQKHESTLQELIESEGRFRQLFIDSQMVFLVIDPDDGSIIHFNKAALSFYKYTQEEMRKLRIYQINTLDFDEIREKMQKSFKYEQNRYLFHHRLSTGEVRDVEVFAGPVVFKGKRYLYSIVNDITDRIVAEKKLRESVLSYKGLFDSVNDAIYIQDHDGRFLDVNMGALKMYGYTRKELIGRYPQFLEAPGLNNHVALSYHHKMAFEGQETEFEFWGKRKNGEIFPKYVRLFKGMYFGRDVVVAIAQDITRRKLEEMELEESRTNLNTLINVSDDVILLLDREGNIIMHNRALLSYYNNRSNYVGENIFNMFPVDVAQNRRKYFEKVLQTKKPVSFEDNNFEKNWWVNFYPILDKNASVSKIAIYARDITMQYKVLNLQKNLQVAEKSAQLKQQFLANMSHEMRTPMNGIVGMADLLSKTELTELQKDYLDTIRDSSHTLLSLINDILDLARFESGKMSIKTETISLELFRRKVLNLFQQQASGKGIVFSVEYSENLPLHILTDEKRLLQVVINLVGNAIKFTPQGEVILRASLVSKKQDQLMMRFEVEDTGIGIDKDYISLLFDEFSQLDNSKTRKYEGTGLGLSISKKIVDLLGGEIGVESRKGQGSKFWFTIATRETKGELVLNMPDKPKADFTPLGLKVLLVDDKIVNRKIAALILKKMGCETDTAVNGLEGVDKVIKNHYDVVLMDIQMPVMDGITAMKAIRNSVKKQPWIIGLSAEAMDGDAEKYIEQGMDDYIAKPIVGHVLYEKLGRVVKTVQ